CATSRAATTAAIVTIAVTTIFFLIFPFFTSYLSVFDPTQPTGIMASSLRVEFEFLLFPLSAIAFSSSPPSSLPLHSFTE
ncbi:MAG: hypothetical protein KAW47_03950, partial [Thermoplasmatales archaeon]|nr:hypothetical protein [Thermoplasmatales archaeon]